MSATPWPPVFSPFVAGLKSSRLFIVTRKSPLSLLRKTLMWSWTVTPPAGSKSPPPFSVYVSRLPRPSRISRFRPVALAGTSKPAAFRSLIERSKASASPVFSMTMANFTRSPASSPSMLLSMGLAASPALVMAPVKEGFVEPGASNVTPVGPTCPGVRTAPASEVLTTPLVTFRSGCRTCTSCWLMTWLTVSPPKVPRSMVCVWLV